MTPIPVNQRPDAKRFEAPTPHVDCYGYRGNDPRLYYLSPWEFTMWWEPVKLQPPVWYAAMYATTPMTTWTPDGLVNYEAHRDDAALVLQPGVDYVPLEEHLCADEIAFPDLHSPNELPASAATT